jgi:hypothetical protein
MLGRPERFRLKRSVLGMVAMPANWYSSHAMLSTTAMLEQKNSAAKAPRNLELFCEPFRALGWRRLELDWRNQS